ncbi:MAG: hypothetical protein AAFN77_01760 [Planctomycetota bacterium]
MGNDLLQKALILMLAAAACFMGYIIYSGGWNRADPDPEQNSGLMKTEAEFRDKLTELKMQRDKVQRGVKRLNGLKAESIQYLRDKGIKSGDDYKNSDDRDIKFAVKNLKEYAAQIAKIEKEVEHYDEAINGIRVMLDRIERERINKSVALSEEESFELQKIILDLNERLDVETDIFEDEELAELLDLEMVDTGD